MSSALKPKKEDVLVDKITLDSTNPRIRWVFEEQPVNEKNLTLALETSTSETLCLAPGVQRHMICLYS